MAQAKNDMPQDGNYEKYIEQLMSQQQAKVLQGIAAPTQQTTSIKVDQRLPDPAVATSFYTTSTTNPKTLLQTAIRPTPTIFTTGSMAHGTEPTLGITPTQNQAQNVSSFAPSAAQSVAQSAAANPSFSQAQAQTQQGQGPKESPLDGSSNPQPQLYIFSWKTSIINMFYIWLVLGGMAYLLIPNEEDLLRILVAIFILGWLILGTNFMRRNKPKPTKAQIIDLSIRALLKRVIMFWVKE